MGTAATPRNWLLGEDGYKMGWPPLFHVVELTSKENRAE